ncbi:MAG TPA: transposase [Lacunisphaera sp.]|nr:transposase [Lacunisphaera sp.]
MPYYSRATAKLLPGRNSIAGACYFLTWCTRNRVRILSEPAVSSTASDAIARLDQTHDGVVLAATIMPDHIHVLLTLGGRLTISQVVAKTKATVSRAHPSVHWQLNFFEHRLRNGASTEDFAFYIFMNPYVAKLCDVDVIWPGWVPSSRVCWSFEEKLRNGRFPQMEWLAQAKRFAETLPAGAD